MSSTIIQSAKPINKGFRRSLNEILEDFSKPIPQRFVKKKPVFSRKNGQLTKMGEVEYVPWTNYIRLLDYFAPGYDWQIRTTHYGDRTIIEGRLTIKAAEGDFVREAVAQDSSKDDGYGDQCANAEQVRYGDAALSLDSD